MQISNPSRATPEGALIITTRMVSLCVCLLLAAVACRSTEALIIDDQPLNGVSEPSAWATLITPDPNYKPLLWVAYSAIARAATVLFTG